jgi:hypothetical protein
MHVPYIHMSSQAVGLTSASDRYQFKSAPAAGDEGEYTVMIVGDMGLGK